MCRLLFLVGWVGAAAGQNALFPSGSYEPISGGERVTWAVRDTIGLPSLMGGLISAGWGTLLDRPPEYGTHALGFSERYGMRLTGIATESVMEAGLGALWGEDPRYFRDADGSFGHRMRHVIKSTFLAEHSGGEWMPACARYAAMAGSSFLSDTWRPGSESNASHAAERIGLGFVGRLAKNTAVEFWPDVRSRVLRMGR